MESSDEDGAFSSTLKFTAAGDYNISILQIENDGKGGDRQTLLSYNLSVQAGLPDPSASSVDGPGLYNAIVGQTAVLWVSLSTQHT